MIHHCFKLLKPIYGIKENKPGDQIAKVKSVGVRYPLLTGPLERNYNLTPTLIFLLIIGSFDPYSDDPRLGVQKIALCPMSATLIVAGTAGQVWI